MRYFGEQVGRMVGRRSGFAEPFRRLEVVFMNKRE